MNQSTLSGLEIQLQLAEESISIKFDQELSSNKIFLLVSEIILWKRGAFLLFFFTK